LSHAVVCCVQCSSGSSLQDEAAHCYQITVMLCEVAWRWTGSRNCKNCTFCLQNLKDKICHGMYRMMLQMNVQFQTLICFTGMLKEAKMIVTVILPSPQDSIMYRLHNMNICTSLLNAGLCAIKWTTLTHSEQ